MIREHLAHEENVFWCYLAEDVFPHTTGFPSKTSHVPGYHKRGHEYIIVQRFSTAET
jgi:hypothetical protein